MMPTYRQIAVLLLTVSTIVLDLEQTIAKDADARLKALVELVARRTAPSLNRLLLLNDDQTTSIEKLGHPTDSAGIEDVAEIHSAGKDYVAVVARRYPIELKHPFGKNGLGICFLFDKRGNLKARFGGQLSTDGVNGDDVQLLTLGTKERWFVMTSRFEKHDQYTKRTDVFLIDNNFPLAFRIWGFPNAMGWTTEPTDNTSEFKQFFNPGDLSWGSFGHASDGEYYELIIGWDEVKKVFRGPSQITLVDKPIYEVDLQVSKRFLPIDK